MHWAFGKDVNTKRMVRFESFYTSHFHDGKGSREILLTGVHRPHKGCMVLDWLVCMWNACFRTGASLRSGVSPQPSFSDVKTSKHNIKNKNINNTYINSLINTVIPLQENYMNKCSKCCPQLWKLTSVLSSVRASI